MLWPHFFVIGWQSTILKPIENVDRNLHVCWGRPTILCRPIWLQNTIIVWDSNCNMRLNVSQIVQTDIKNSDSMAKVGAIRNDGAL